jgi:NAD(P)H-nitrite reductase large subunit
MMEENKQVNNENKGSRKLVKCIVCGEIFDSSYEICPVCGVDKSNFIPYVLETTDFKKNTEEYFLILGNGVAGVNAAAAIRERNDTCSIVILSNEPVLCYNRPMLTKSLVTKIEPKEIAVYDKSWYEEHRIINVLSTNLNSINIKDKYVVFDDNKKILYSKCIYALGAECFIPPIKGSDKKEVIAIRRYTDVKKIGELLPSIKNVVVIGGGVLGLEAAWEMKKVGCNVTVLEVADKLMVRQLDNEAGELLGEIIKDADIKFHLNANISKIIGEDKVTGVKLDDGRLFLADLVIISSGVRSNIELAKSAGIEVNRSIIVNEKMETSVSDIYACGDCAEYKGLNYAIWPQAIEMGKVAGANAAGDNLTYEIVPAALTFHGMNTALFSIGDNGKDETLTYATKEIRVDNRNYEKYYFVDNILVGVILIGDTKKMVDMTMAIQEKRTYDKMF